MSTEFLSEFSYSEKEKSGMEDLIKFYEREPPIEPDEAKKGNQTNMKINDCQEDFELNYQQVLQKGFHTSNQTYFQGLVEAYENEMKENKCFDEEEELKIYEPIEEDLEYEYEKVLNQFQADKKELKDELVKAYEREMIEEVDDVHVRKETKDFVESPDWKYYEALEKGLNRVREN